jgi:hypothetical protein
MRMQRPIGVTLIAIALCLIGAYICCFALIALTSPVLFALALLVRRFPFFYAFEIANPYLTLLVGTFWIVIGWGLFKLQNWARVAAMVAIVAGTGMVLSGLILASAHTGWSLLWGVLEVFVRLMVVGYLFSASVAERFLKPAKAR